MTRLAFVAYGRPVPQGAIRHLGAGRPAVHANAEQLKPWRVAVTTAAVEQATHLDIARFTEPVVLRAAFYFDRPKNHYRTGRNAHLLRDDAPPFPANRSSGDLDKLVRAIGDALVPTLLVDDSLIVTWRAAKRWTSPSAAMQTPGAVVEVEHERPPL